MVTDREKINNILKVNVVPFLREIGFKGTFPNFKRVDENKIDLLTFQFSQYGKRFVVEIAQCSANGITFNSGQKIPPEKVGVYHCFPPNRTRIPIKKEDIDCWIDYENIQLNKIPEQVLSLIKTEAVPWWKNKRTSS